MRLPPLSALTVAAAMSLNLPSVLGAADGIPDNPFKPRGVPGGPTAIADEAVEFAGVSQMGKTTHLIFHDKSAKKNRWVAVGETVEGISAVRYDERLEQAVVKINGAEKTLPLRKGKGPVNTPTPVQPLPAAAGWLRLRGRLVAGRALRPVLLLLGRARLHLLADPPELLGL